MHAHEQPQSAPAEGTSPHKGACPRVDEFLSRLKESRLVPPLELNEFLARTPTPADADVPRFGRELIDLNLINEYQLKRVMAGQTFGLVLGNNRILRILGQGGMAVVYKAEHIYLKRTVAVKVLVIDGADNDRVFVQRFTSEMEALARLRHPHIVLAFDAGEEPIPDAPGKVLHYLAMEYVSGHNLEDHVLEHGPLPIPAACEYIRQAALGLQHAHGHGLLHRDIKPSNLQLTGLPRKPGGRATGNGERRDGHVPVSVSPPGRIKILDFGLARLYRRRCTEARALLGTVDYMAPEQARDARLVDARADIFALGGTFYWLLTGRRPFPGDRSVVEELSARQFEAAPSPRALRPEVPPDLEGILSRMMAGDPDDRYPSLLPFLSALDGFLASSGPAGPGWLPAPRLPEGSGVLEPAGEDSASDSETAVGIPAATDVLPRPSGKVLLVSARPACRAACREALEGTGVRCEEVVRTEDVLPAIEGTPAGVLLIDEQLAGGSGPDLCRSLRQGLVPAHVKVVLLSERPGPPSRNGRANGKAREAGAWCDDRLCWTDGEDLAGRVRLLLRLREAEARAARMAHHLLATNRQLERMARQRDQTLSQGQEVLIFGMAKMAELRGQETGAHLLRMRGYVRVLAEEAGSLPAFQGQIDDDFVAMLERCALLHDIGKVAIPDHVLLKPGRLDAEERLIMESHTILGADLLEAVTRQYGVCLAFLDMATDVVRYHHERYDGTGYPAGLSGNAIPLAARIVALADAYDAIRSRLVYKPELAHPAASRLLLSPGQGQFDPALLTAFRKAQDGLALIFKQHPD
jgi:response regulator RpfG family c-di-GMP phosphodiesterase/serine/threonine protein kinase